MKKAAVLACLVIFALFVSAFRFPSRASTPASALIQVTTLNPAVNSGDLLCSLPEAILNANLNSQVSSTDCSAGVDDGDMIVFRVSGQVVLGAALPVITEGVEIHGSPHGTAISGADTYIVLDYDSTVLSQHLVLEDLTIEHGNAGDTYGGGLRSQKGYVEISRCTFRSNQAKYAGAIFNGAGDMSLTNSTIYGNEARNGASSYGGGLVNGGGWGVTIVNATFYANKAYTGGSNLYNGSGGIFMSNSIVAGGLTTSNCAGTITDMSNNLDSGNSCGFNTSHGSLINTDPLLGEPGWHGGQTDTLPLLSSSPAIDGVTYNEPNGSLDIDQREYPRPRDGNGDETWRHDIGAYEFGEPKVFLPVIAVP